MGRVYMFLMAAAALGVVGLAAVSGIKKAERNKIEAEANELRLETREGSQNEIREVEELSDGDLGRELIERLQRPGNGAK